MKVSKVLWGIMLFGLPTWGANIAFIDSQKVFNSHPEAKNAREALNREVATKQAELKVDEEEIMALREELLSGKSLSNEARKKKEAIIKAKIEALEESRQSAISAFTEKQTKLEEGINKKIYGLISVLAKNKKIDVVLDKRSIIYGLPTLDMTEEIIKKINPKEAKKGGRK